MRTRDVVAAVPVLYKFLHSGGNHWSLLVINKTFKRAELWGSSEITRHEYEVVHEVLKYVQDCGVRNASSFKIVGQQHPDWSQDDASSCGMFALLILLSLITDRQVCISQSDIQLWRKFFLSLMHDTLVGMSIPDYFGTNSGYEFDPCFGPNEVMQGEAGVWD